MTDKEIKEILSTMTVIVDTREHIDCNSHIIDYLAAKGIPCIRRCLKFADYSFEITVSGEVISFENRLVFERKMSLTELSGNVCQARERFETEFAKSKEAGAKMVLMVEDGSWQGIIDKKYRSDLNPASYVASLFAFKARYDIDIEFLPAKLSGWFMASSFKYAAREYLKGVTLI